MNATSLWYFSYHHSLLRPFVHKVMRLLYSCDAYAPTRMGGGNILEHNGLGVVISKMVILGSNCHISQNVTIRAGKMVIHRWEIM